MNTVKISGQVKPEKKELIELLMKKANVTADEIIDNAFTQWIRQNLDLLTEKDKQKFGKYLINK